MKYQKDSVTKKAKTPTKYSYQLLTISIPFQYLNQAFHGDMLQTCILFFVRKSSILIGSEAVIKTYINIPMVL